MSWCVYCKPSVSQGCCAVKSTDGWECTREPGHKGKHVSCGRSAHEIKKWDQEPFTVEVAAMEY